MTTIAWCNGFVAADSRVCDSNSGIIEPHEIEKIWRSGGMIFGIVGGVDGLYTLREWLEYRNPDAPDRPVIATGTTLIEFRQDGRIFEHGGVDDTLELKPRQDFYAWGSGRGVALGALELGASAAEAVVLAAKYDSGTGGTIRELRVAPAAEDQESY